MDPILRIYTFTDKTGEVIWPSEVDAELDQLVSAINTLAEGLAQVDTQILTDTTNTNNYIISSPGVTYVDGKTYKFRFSHGNTGAVTVNINSYGVKEVIKYVFDEAATTAPLSEGDIITDQILLASFNSALDKFILLNSSNVMTCGPTNPASPNYGQRITGKKIIPSGSPGFFFEGDGTLQAQSIWTGGYSFAKVLELVGRLNLTPSQAYVSICCNESPSRPNATIRPGGVATDLDLTCGGKGAGKMYSTQGYEYLTTNTGYLKSEVVTLLAGKEPANANIQAHVTSTHAPSNAQKNSDITKAEIEAKLTGEISTHTHAGGGGITEVNYDDFTDELKAMLELKSNLRYEFGASTWFYGPGGNDTTGDGSWATPYLTISRVLQDIPANLAGRDHYIMYKGSPDPATPVPIVIDYDVTVQDKYNGTITFAVAESELSGGEWGIDSPMVISRNFVITRCTAPVVFWTSVEVPNDTTGSFVISYCSSVDFWSSFAVRTLSDTLGFSAMNSLIYVDAMHLVPGMTFQGGALVNSKLYVLQLGVDPSATLAPWDKVTMDSKGSVLSCGEITESAARLLYGSMAYEAMTFSPFSPSSLPSVTDWGGNVIEAPGMWNLSGLGSESSGGSFIHIDQSVTPGSGNWGYLPSSPVSSLEEAMYILDELTPMWSKSYPPSRTPLYNHNHEFGITFVAGYDGTLDDDLYVRCSAPGPNYFHMKNHTEDTVTIRSVDFIGFEEATVSYIDLLGSLYCSNHHSSLSLEAVNYVGAPGGYVFVGSQGSIELSGVDVSGFEVVAYASDYVSMDQVTGTGNGILAACDGRVSVTDSTVEFSTMLERESVDLQSTTVHSSLGDDFISLGELIMSTEWATLYRLVGLSSDLTIGEPVGIKGEYSSLRLRVQDDGTPRNLTWNSVFVGLCDDLPSTTEANVPLYMNFRFNPSNNKWEMVSSSLRAASSAPVNEVPDGGATGEVLTKQSSADQDVLWHDPRKPNRNGPLVIEQEFMNSTATNWPGLAGAAISSGTMTNVNSSSFRNKRAGVIAISDSTTAGGGYGVSSPSDYYLAGDEEMVFVFATPSSLRSTAEGRMGLTPNPAAAAPANGVFLTFTNATLKGRCVVSSAGTDTANTLTLSADTWYAGVIKVNSDKTSVNFKVYSDTGSLLFNEDVASNIPSGAVALRFSAMGTESTTGAAAEIIRLDYISLYAPKAFSR